MARQERIQFPGACYHLMARGNAGGDIFADDEDRRMFLDLLGKLATESRWRVHAWCLMSNHFHLLVTTPEANLSKTMHRFVGTYSQRINRRHSRQGHLFQGRYKSLLVASDAYFIQLHRYILRNPMEAGLVSNPLKHPWSSAVPFMTKNQEAWMDFDFLERQIKAYKEDRANSLRQFLSAETPAPVALQGRAYGEEIDLQRLNERVAALPDDLVRPALSSFYDPRLSPAEMAARAVLLGPYRAADAARHFSAHKSSVSRALRKLEYATNQL